MKITKTQIETLAKFGIPTEKLTSQEINRLSAELFLNSSKTVQADCITAKGIQDKATIKRHNTEKVSLSKALNGTVESNLDKILSWHTEGKKANKDKESFSLANTKALKKAGFEVIVSVMVRKVKRVVKKA